MPAFVLVTVDSSKLSNYAGSFRVEALKIFPPYFSSYKIRFTSFFGAYSKVQRVKTQRSSTLAKKSLISTSCTLNFIMETILKNELRYIVSTKRKGQAPRNPGGLGGFSLPFFKKPLRTRDKIYFKTLTTTPSHTHTHTCTHTHTHTNKQTNKQTKKYTQTSIYFSPELDQTVLSLLH